MNDDAGPKADSARHATVMFADISGFTALGERLDPEQVIGIVNGCFERLEEIVYAHGGAIDEYLGDCIKAAFGLTLTAGDGASHAVAAALAMRDAIAKYNIDRSIEPPLGIHIGISTGTVATVPTGSEGHNKTCVMGEAARIASHLEDASERGQIFVGPETHAATRRAFEYRRVETKKSHEGAPRVYELVRPIPRTERARESERRRATILFADLIGTDDIAPDERALEAEMGALFEAMRAAVVEYGGIVNQYTGDGVMALFGIPNAIEDAPKQALNSALRIRELVESYAADKRVPLAVHIGVNTGLVIAGEIGGSVRKSFTGVGETVNMSARIKEAAPPGAIQVGPETHRLTRESFEFEALEPMRFKGKTEPMPVYRLASRTRQVHRRSEESGQRIFSDLVGRAADLDQLRQSIARLESGVGGAVSLIAEAGLGKTRLLTEALARVDRERVQVLPARSISIGAGLSFHPFVDLLRAWAGIDEHDSESDALEKLEAAMAATGEATAEAFPFVATVLGFRPHGPVADRIAEMDGDAIERLVTKHLRDLLGAIARGQPTIVVMEDVHWADRSSVNLLASVLTLARTFPLLFYLVMRPDAESGDFVLRAARGDLGTRHTEIALSPLGAQEVNDLVRNLLDIDNLSAAVRDTITEKAGGNPFFIEEVVRELVDTGAIAVHEGRFRVTDKMVDVVIPSTVQEVIMVRIDRLDESKRHILQVASVIGRSFSYTVIADLVDRASTLPGDLRQLRDKQILVEQAPQWDIPVGGRTILEELQYMFKHALAQETIYSSILHQTRRELHGRLAGAIESKFPERLKEFYGQLSYHYARAENFPKAEAYSFRAGEEAARSGATREALQHFLDSARIDLQLHGANGDPQHRELIEKNIGLALMNTGRLPESLPHFDRALVLLGEHVPESNVEIQRAFAVNLTAVLLDAYVMARNRRRRVGTERDREFFEILSARARAGVTSDPRRIFYDNIGGVRRINGIDPRSFEHACPMYAVAGGMFSFSGLSFDMARRFLSRAKACAAQTKPSNVFDCRHLEFTINYLAGDWRDEDLLEPALIDEAVRNGLFWDLQTYLGLACDRLQRQGRFAEAQKHFDRLAELRDGYGFAFAGTNYDGERAMFHLERRDLAAAHESVERYLRGRDEYALRVLALGTKAKILAHAGEREASAAVLGEAQSIIAERSRVIPPWHASAYALARLHVDVETAATSNGTERKRALARAEKSRRYALRTTRTVASQRTEALRLAGTACWLANRPRKARAFWSKSIELGERIGALPELARTQLEVATHLPPSELIAGFTAREHRARALGSFEELGLDWDVAAAGSSQARAA